MPDRFVQSWDKSANGAMHSPGKTDSLQPASQIAKRMIILTIICSLAVPNSGQGNSLWTFLQLVLALAIAGVLLSGLVPIRWNMTTVMLPVLTLLPLIGLTSAIQFQSVISTTSSAALLLGICLLAGSLNRPGIKGVLRAVITGGLFEVTLGVVQQWIGRLPTWGFLGDRDTAYLGVNELVSWLPGRSVGTLAHPILLGLLCGFGIVAVLLTPDLMRSSLRLSCALVLSVGVAESGTRSVALAVVVAVLSGLVMKVTSNFGAIGRNAALFLLVGLGTAALIPKLPFLQGLAGSFSLLHRLNSINGVPLLLKRPGIEVFLGSGRSSLESLYASGYLIDDGSHAVDNQFVSSFATTGLIGVAILVIILIRRLVHGTSPFVELGVFCTIQMLTFDALMWSAVSSLLAITLCAQFQKLTAVAQHEAPSLVVSSYRQPTTPFLKVSRSELWAQNKQVHRRG